MSLSWSRILSSRATLLSAVMVFVSSVLWLPIEKHSPSDAGRLLFELLPLSSPRNQPRGHYYDDTWFRYTNGTFAPISEDDLARGAHDNPTSHMAHLFVAGTGHFIWAEIEREEGMRIVLDSQGLTPEEIALFRRTYVDYLATRDEWLKPHAATLYTTDTLHTVPIWSGWLHNAISLLSFLIVILSFPLVAMRLLREHRINKGLCPHCRYDRSGLTSDSPCPECGKIANTAA